MKKTWIYCLICLMLFGLMGCAKEQVEVQSDSSSLYYLNTPASKLIAEEYIFKVNDTDGQIEEMYTAIATGKDSEKQLALLPADVRMESWVLKEGTLWINFNANYAYMEATREVLVRAGIVRSFANIDKVTNVGFMVEDKELLDAKGEPVGLMRANDFVEDSGKDVNAYNYVTMKLYFANREGDKLVLEERKVYYSKNTPLERAVVEQLLEGPRSSEHYATIPTETKILGVSTMDGLGYVNLDQAFLNATLPVQGEVALQSIVKSIVEACDVGKVQISINGETKVDYRGNISLDQIFEVDNSLLEVNR